MLIINKQIWLAATTLESSPLRAPKIKEKATNCLLSLFFIVEDLLSWDVIHMEEHLGLFYTGQALAEC